MTHSTPTAADLAALRWACLVDPFADLPRLVLADALADVGDTEREQWIRSSCEDQWGKQYPASAAMCREHRPFADVPTWIPDDVCCVVRRGFIEEVHAPMGLILANLNVFRLHPITQVGVSDKRPELCLDGWGWTDDSKGMFHLAHHIPTEVWKRLPKEPDKRFPRDKYHPTRDTAMDALSRAIVSLGREHAGLPQLKWPT